MPVQVGAANRQQARPDGRPAATRESVAADTDGAVESEPRPAASKPAVHPPDPPVPLLAEAPAVVTGRPHDWWASLNDEQLLDVRMCDLGLTIEGSKLVASIAQLHGELENRKLAFEPHYWLSDEWFTPDGVGGVAIPFYLAHPRLEQLEERQMLEVEGGTHDWCVKILRHEAGHAIDNAYQLQRRRKRLKLFGPSTVEYPEYYTPKPYSKSFVLHLDSWYAQSHPDEDFAETFAVWLNPRSQWRDRYADWPALKKLEYMDELMRELAGHPARRVSRRKLAPLPQPEEDTAAALRPQARALRLRAPELLRPRSAPAVHRGDRGAQGQPAGHAFPRPHPQGRLPPRLALDRRVPLHHRPRLRGRDRPLPRAEPAAGQASGGGDTGVHDSTDRRRP